MLSIQWTKPTVKALHKRLQQAYHSGHKQQVRRVSVLLAVGQHGAEVASVAQQWGLSPAIVYAWLRAFLIERLASLPYHWGGGRKPKLTTSQKQQLCAWLDAGPLACGFTGGCWSSVLIAALIQREWGITYSRFYLCTLLKHLGYSFQKAQLVAAQLDAPGRQAWLQEVWPQILRQAKRRQALLLFEDEASFAQWGSLSYTWARSGHTPQVQTSGIRKAYKVFGAVDFFSGRLFYQGHEGRFNSDSYQAFLEQVLSQTTQPVFLIQDGARYHTSARTRQFFADHAARLSVFQLPSYSPDYNPIEYLWRNAKKEATHNKYFAQFEHLSSEVERTLALFAQQPQMVLNLFGRYTHESGLSNQPLKLAA